MQEKTDDAKIDSVCERLLDSEEHAVEAAIPPIAEDAVELIRALQQAIKELRCNQIL